MFPLGSLVEKNLLWKGCGGHKNEQIMLFDIEKKETDINYYLLVKLVQGEENKT